MGRSLELPCESPVPLVLESRAASGRSASRLRADSGYASGRNHNENHAQRSTTVTFLRLTDLMAQKSPCTVQTEDGLSAYYSQKPSQRSAGPDEKTRKGYLRGRVLSQYKLNAVSDAFRNQVDTSLTWKGGSPGSRSRLSTSVISSAVLGFLILFNARLICASRRFAFGTWLIRGTRVGKPIC